MAARNWPSKSCVACKARKIKCDESLPSCMRCIKGDFHCQYKDRNEVIFRNETAKVGRRARQRWRTRCKPDSSSLLFLDTQQRNTSLSPRDLKHNSASDSSQCSVSPTESQDVLSVGVAHQLGSPSEAPIYGTPFDSTSSISERSYDLGDASYPSASTPIVKSLDATGTPFDSVLSLDHNVYDNALTPYHSPSIPIVPSVSAALNMYAERRFFYDFVCSRKDSNPDPSAFLGYIPNIDQITPDKFLVHHAFSAVALANYASRFKREDAQIKAAMHYGKALRRLVSSIQSPGSEETQEKLLAVCLLGLYDFLSPNESAAPSLAHISGAVALLQNDAMYELSIVKSPAASLFYWVFIQMIMKCLSDGTRPMLPLPVCHLIPQADLSQFRLLEIMYDVAVFCSTADQQFAQLNDAKTVDMPALQALLVTAESLDERLELFSKGLALEDPFFKEHTSSSQEAESLRSLLSAPGTPRYTHHYASLLAATSWNRYRTTRLILNGKVLGYQYRLMRLNGSHDLRACYVAKERTAFCIEEICESAISCISTGSGVGDTSDARGALSVPSIRGYSIVWSLLISATYYMLTNCGPAGAGGDRHQWIRMALKHLDVELGISAAANILRAIDGVIKERGTPSLVACAPGAIETTAERSGMTIVVG